MILDFILYNEYATTIAKSANTTYLGFMVGGGGLYI